MAPLVARLWWDHAATVSGSVARYKQDGQGAVEEDGSLLWAVIESPHGGQNPSVLLGALSFSDAAGAASRP